MTDHWFKPKRYGYGATRPDWKGWAATAAFILVVVATSLVTFAWQPGDGTRPGYWQIAGWPFAGAVLACAGRPAPAAKSDGQWGWG